MPPPPGGWTALVSAETAALLGKYRAGSQAVLQIIDGEGVVSGSLELNEQVLSLAAAGRYFAVLTGNRLDIYTSDLTLYATLDGTQGARRVLLQYPNANAPVEITCTEKEDGTVRMEIAGCEMQKNG